MTDTPDTSDDPGLIHAPWTRSQVRALNTYQRSGVFHEFTCGANIARSADPRVTESCRYSLVATADGWCCPRCGQWKQTWAHAFMAERPPCACGRSDLGKECVWLCPRGKWDTAARALSIEAAQ